MAWNSDFFGEGFEIVNRPNNTYERTVFDIVIPQYNSNVIAEKSKCD